MRDWYEPMWETLFTLPYSSALVAHFLSPSFAKLVPCDKCRRGLKEYLTLFPPAELVNNRLTYLVYLCALRSNIYRKTWRFGANSILPPAGALTQPEDATLSYCAFAEFIGNYVPPRQEKRAAALLSVLQATVSTTSSTGTAALERCALSMMQMRRGTNSSRACDRCSVKS